MAQRSVFGKIIGLITLVPLSFYPSRQSIATTNPPRPQDGESSCYWSLTPTGEFSVSSAYKAEQELSWQPADSRLNLIWKWPGAERVRTFLWLAVKGCLLTNAERTRRHMDTDSSCSLCHHPTETIEHILKDCPFAAECWKMLRPRDASHRDLQISFADWIFSNLRPMSKGEVWPITFGLLYWKLWDNRNSRINSRIFEDHSLSPVAIANSVNVSVEHTIRTRNFLTTLAYQRASLFDIELSLIVSVQFSFRAYLNSTSEE